MVFRKKKKVQKIPKQKIEVEVIDDGHAIKIFDHPVLIARIVSSANFPFVHEHITDICGLFSDIMFLERQLAAHNNETIYEAYDKVVEESKRLFEALYLSEDRSGEGIVDRKYGEHITFRAQDSLYELVEGFWEVVKNENIEIVDKEDIYRTSVDTFFPLSLCYIHIFGNKRPFLKKLEKLHSHF